MLTPRNLKSWCLAGGGRLDAGVQFTYKGLKLELVDNFRYLGVTFSRSCSFDLCVDILTKSGQKAMMAMLNRAHILGGLDIDMHQVRIVRYFGCSNFDVRLRGVGDKVPRLP